jgi:hypothetical protein
LSYDNLFMAVATGSDPVPSRWHRFFTRIQPAWADRRVRILLGVIAISIAAGWYWFSATSATLTVAGHHGFRRAQVSIWVDGDLKSQYEVSGSAKKRFGVLEKVDGVFSRSLRVATGDHNLRVRFQSLTDSSDITRQCRVSVQAGTESTVYVNADRGLMSLSFAGSAPRIKSSPEPPSEYAKTLQSIFMAIAGSALSATVGFVVQDFLRSRRASQVSKLAS